jgi:hypothetical protein
LTRVGACVRREESPRSTSFFDKVVLDRQWRFLFIRPRQRGLDPVGPCPDRQCVSLNLAGRLFLATLLTLPFSVGMFAYNFIIPGSKGNEKAEALDNPFDPD